MMPSPFSLSLAPLTLAVVAPALLILFFASLTKATLGFGESMVAIPLLTLVIGIQTAAPLVSLIAATVTLFIIGQSWREIDLTATWRLLLAAMVGVPLGVWGLVALPAEWVTGGLGVLLIWVGLNYLIKPPVRGLTWWGWSYLLGFLAGLFGGAYNISGPPVLIYGASRRWPPERFRATLQSFFLPVSALILAGHAGAGLWTREVLLLYVLSWPVMLLAFWLGSRLSRHLTKDLFERAIYMALVLVGILLIL